jgi:hypothetical protein
MRKDLVVMALISVPAIALGGFTPGTYPDRAPAWKRFAVKDVQLGTQTATIAGFTCDANAGEYRHTCVRFLDDACKAKATFVKYLRSSSDLPAGQGCTYDSGTGATYLDRKFHTPALSSVAVVGTDTDVPRAYEITYRFTKDVLTDSSNIGKTLIAKYGKPTFTNPPTQMSWKVDPVNLFAECDMRDGGDCMVKVIDDGLLDAERSIKQAAEHPHAKASGLGSLKL